MDSWIEREILAKIEQLFRRDDDLIGLNKYLLGLAEANRTRIGVRKTQANAQWHASLQSVLTRLNSIGPKSRPE